MLRLPTYAPNSAKLVSAKASIAELGLFASNAFVCGVSGGGRKVVSIGHELLVNPSLVVLDEPTSDSTSAFRLFSTLSALTRRGARCELA
jgi:ABC-type multidrug transport system ATPase subunit